MNMENYYLAGYYLIKTKPIDFGDDKGKVVQTCSRCINHSVFDNWCLSWMSDQLSEEEINELNLDKNSIDKIRKWTDERFENGSNIFPDFVTANEFKSLFFNRQPDLDILGMYFDETEANKLITEFGEGVNVDKFNYNNGNFPMRNNLENKSLEMKNPNEELIGFDFIGVECDGSIHSFYCQNITKSLVEKFDLEINLNGLINEPKNKLEIKKYLNDPSTGLEPLPWFIVKVKRRIKSSS